MIKKQLIIDFIKKTVPATVLLAPHYGLFPQATRAVGNLYQNGNISTAGSFLAVALLATDQYLKYVKPPEPPVELDEVKGSLLTVAPPIEQITLLAKWRTNQPFTLWGQHFKLEDFMTSCLIVGTSGTGKTSAGFDHFLNDMSRMLSSEDSKSREAKFGGFFLDVKNQFFVRVLYFMARSGRNPLTDLKVISPYSQKIVGEWEDPDTGYRFFMNASHYPTGTAVSDFLMGVKRNNGQEFPENILSVYDSRFTGLINELKSMEVPVGEKKLNCIGWRYQGDKMLRVVRNVDLTTLDVYEKSGKRIKIDPPKKLRFIRKVLVESGTKYNIIDNSLPASAISQQLMKVAKLANGGGGGGNDSFWVGSTEAQVINCINLWRIVHEPDKEITGPDILKFTTNQDFLDKYLKELKDRKRNLANELLMAGDDKMKRQEIEDSLQGIESITTYFTVTWAQKDIKQRTTVEQMIINLFNVFQNDEHLKRSFCSPSTFNFKECMNDGRVFVLVPGADYSENAKVIGTLLKLHFQKVALERVDSSTMNRTRTVIFGADEVQRYVVAASASEGDPDFNNLSRESLIINIVATQTDASIADLIKSAADSYFSSHGIRLYFNVDETGTRKRAVEICAQTVKETKYKRKGDDMNFHSIMEGKSMMRGEESEKEKKNFTSEDFVMLKKWESICFNKFATNHGKKLAVRFQNKPHEYGAPASACKIKALVDWYQTANLETCLFKQDLTNFVDHDQHIKADLPIEKPEKDGNEKATVKAEGSGGSTVEKKKEEEFKTPKLDEGSLDTPIPPIEVEEKEPKTDESEKSPLRNSIFADDEESDPYDGYGEPDVDDTPIQLEEQENPSVDPSPSGSPNVRPRSPVARRVHKDSKGMSPKGEFAMFASDVKKPSDVLPDSIHIEGGNHDYNLESLMEAESKSEPDSTEQSEAENTAESPTTALGRALEASFEMEEAEDLYNENQLVDLYEEYAANDQPHSSIDSITTGRSGYASDKDGAPKTKGLTSFPTAGYDPEALPPAREALTSYYSKQRQSKGMSYNKEENKPRIQPHVSI